MALPGEIAVSFQPWYISSLPPRALNLLRSGFTALTIDPTFSSTIGRALSRSNVFQSQFALLYATWNDPTEIGGAVWPPTYPAKPGAPPSSAPGTLPGNTTCPDLVFAGEYARFIALTCDPVRQFSASPALHWSDATSNVHFIGSLSTPSATPSFASHALIMALLTRASFAGGTALAVSFNTGTDVARSQLWRCVW